MMPQDIGSGEMPFAVMLALTLVLVTSAWIAHGVCRSAARGDLPRNGAVGLRLPSTRTSEEAWAAGHAAATGVLRWFALVTSVFGLGALLVSSSPVLWVVFFLVGALGLVVGVLAGAVTASRAARALSGGGAG